MMTETSTPEISMADLADWLAEQQWSDFAQSLAGYYRRTGRLSHAQEASARSMYAKVIARRAAKTAEAPDNATKAPVTPGFYVVNATLHKVVRGQRGQYYALRRGENGGWEYARGLISEISADDRVTPEQAVEFGLRTGVCIFCSADLDDREGLGRIVGVGPTCSRNHLGMTQRQLANHMGIDIAAEQARMAAEAAAALAEHATQ